MNKMAQAPSTYYLGANTSTVHWGVSRAADSLQGSQSVVVPGCTLGAAGSINVARRRDLGRCSPPESAVWALPCAHANHQPRRLFSPCARRPLHLQCAVLLEEPEAQAGGQVWGRCQRGDGGRPRPVLARGGMWCLACRHPPSSAPGWRAPLTCPPPPLLQVTHHAGDYYEKMVKVRVLCVMGGGRGRGARAVSVVTLACSPWYNNRPATTPAPPGPVALSRRPPTCPHFLQGDKALEGIYAWGSKMGISMRGATGAGALPHRPL